MIVFSIVCNFCGEQIEIPDTCPEDDFSWRKDKTGSPKSPTFGLSFDVRLDSIKSYEWYRNRKKNVDDVNNLTFCSKDCIVEYIKKNVTDEGFAKK